MSSKKDCSPLLQTPGRVHMVLACFVIAVPLFQSVLFSRLLNNKIVMLPWRLGEKANYAFIDDVVSGRTYPRHGERSWRRKIYSSGVRMFAYKRFVGNGEQIARTNKHLAFPLSSLADKSIRPCWNCSGQNWTAIEIRWSLPNAAKTLSGRRNLWL